LRHRPKPRTGLPIPHRYVGPEMLLHGSMTPQKRRRAAPMGAPCHLHVDALRPPIRKDALSLTTINNLCQNSGAFKREHLQGSRRFLNSRGRQTPLNRKQSRSSAAVGRGRKIKKNAVGRSSWRCRYQNAPSKWFRSTE